MADSLLHYHYRDHRRLVVVVDDVESARIALRWAMQNVVRGGDIVTLLHVLPPPPSASHSSSCSSSSSSSSQAGKLSNTKQALLQGSKFFEEARRLLRLKGFQLALSFKELCDQYPETRVEIVVMEGDEGPTIVSLAKRLGASTLILGQHKRGFFWRILGRKDTPEYCIKNSECQVLAVQQKNRRKGAFQSGKMSSQVRIVRYL